MAVAGADWQRAADYVWLRTADRSAFAWEWLRRRDDYDRMWRSAAEAARFGLLAAENPACDARAARPFWSAVLDPSVLIGVITSDGGADQFDIERLRGVLHRRDDAAGEHLLFSDGLHALRVDIVAGSIMEGLVALDWRLPRLDDATPAILTLRRLAALYRTGCFARFLHPPERGAMRWIAMLRAQDAVACGASHREIAAALFGDQRIGPRWRVSASSLRLRTQRLVGAASHALEAGPRHWLCADDPVAMMSSG